MILWGNIRHFSVFMILQLLSGFGKSGILEIEDDEEKAFIYLDEGHVDAVSLPRSDHLMGARLVKYGHVSEEEIQSVLMSAAMQKEYLGITLTKSGLVEDDAMEKVIREQTYDNTLELSNWVSGTFRFLPPSQETSFTVSASLNAQHLLLETSRRLDEGERPSKTKEDLPGDDLCASCSSGCKEIEKMKYLKADGICLWRNMPVVVREQLFTGPEKDILYEKDDAENMKDLPFL
ncbi:MAG: DUF4388 domain-containing protein [Thermoleophilia bacterium]|nr:DUF4388 domain-containing protein [Thermoleophilia bacterium]